MTGYFAEAWRDILFFWYGFHGDGLKLPRKSRVCHSFAQQKCYDRLEQKGREAK